MNDFSPYDPEALPPVLVRYLEAQADSSTRSTIANAFADTARVVDEGIEYSGIAAIRGWLSSTASAYTFTTTFLGQQHPDVERWVVLARLEGDFPGGVADLRFRATVSDGRIHDLVIAP